MTKSEQYWVHILMLREKSVTTWSTSLYIYFFFFSIFCITATWTNYPSHSKVLLPTHHLLYKLLCCQSFQTQSFIWQYYFNYFVSDFLQGMMSLSWAKRKHYIKTDSDGFNCGSAANLEERVARREAWSHTDLWTKTLIVIFEGFVYNDTKAWAKHLSKT